MSQGETAGAEEFAALMAGLRDFRDRLPAGDLPDRALARAAKVSPTTIASWLTGTQFPQDIGKILTVVRAITARAEARGIGSGVLPNEDLWRAAHRAEASRRAGAVSAGVQRAQAQRILAAGRSLAEVNDPFTLEVHRPVQPDQPQPDLSPLPTYVLREHDTQLQQEVTAAAEGRSGIAVLVGGSSTGKTRACWEVLSLLRDRPEPWRLWHPIDPTRPEAALKELSEIGPRTVVWLNEAQFYLDAAGGLGERVAAGLRELLRDRARAPVLVLATLWPQFWDALTARPAGGADPYAQARELLAGHDITVPGAFSAAQLQQLSRVEDARLAQAAAAARDGQVIQFLAGAPELLARYRHSPPAAAALIHAAMDARRLGMGVALPQAFIEAAAPDYLTDNEWDALGEDWLEQALAYVAVPCKGVRGPLTRIRPRPGRSGALPPRAISGTHSDNPADVVRVPVYQLADYLDQHGRRHRKGRIPPEAFWAAAADYASPPDQARLGNAAHDRGLYRIATQLHKNAAVYGNSDAISYLIHPPRCLGTDVQPLGWAAAHAPLDNPATVATLLRSLRRAGALNQAAALATRAATHAPLDNPATVVMLVDTLQKVDAQDQAAALAARAATQVPLDNPAIVARLLHTLRRAGAKEQAAALAARAATQAPLDNPAAVGTLLHILRDRGALDQVTVLAARAATQVPLGNPAAVATLVDTLQEVEAPDQAAALATRAATHAPLDNLAAVARLLHTLRRAGAKEQAAALAARAAAHAPLGNPAAVATLVDTLQEVQEVKAPDQAAALATRAAAQAPVDNPAAVATLVDTLRRAGARDQASALLRRSLAAQAPLDAPGTVTALLIALGDTGVGDQAAVLAARAAAQAPLDNPAIVARLLHTLRDAGAQDQAAALAARAATHAPLDNPAAVGTLLHILRSAGARDQAAALAARAATQVPLGNPAAVATLVDTLQEVEAPDLAAALATRAATDAPVDNPAIVARLLHALRDAGARDQAAALATRAATHASVENPDGVTTLLIALREAEAPDLAAALAARATAHAPVDDPDAVTTLLIALREVGAWDQAAALADRATAQIPVNNLFAVATLLIALRDACALDQAAALAARAAAQAPLNDPGAVATLLDALPRAGALDQAVALATRATGQTQLDNLFVMTTLLSTLREAGAHDEAAALTVRLPEKGMFELFLKQDDHEDRFLFGRKLDGSPAEAWTWKDLT
jgi:hypothetical protein